MTASNSDQEAVRALLREADLGGDDALEAALLDLRGLGSTPLRPSDELAVLMTPVRPRPRPRAGAIVAIAVVASLGTGLSAAAVGPTVREATNRTVETLLGVRPLPDAGVRAVSAASTPASSSAASSAPSPTGRTASATPTHPTAAASIPAPAAAHSRRSTAPGRAEHPASRHPATPHPATGHHATPRPAVHTPDPRPAHGPTAKPHTVGSEHPARAKPRTTHRSTED